MQHLAESTLALKSQAIGIKNRAPIRLINGGGVLTYYSVIYGFVVIWNLSIRLSKFTVSSIAFCPHYWAINPVKEYAVMTLSSA